METGEPRTQEYLLQKEHHNGIIRVASYHRKDFDLAVIKINPRDHERIRTSLAQPARVPATNLGRLGVLPLEMLHEICQLLDIRSLFKFRQVNLRAQEVVCAIYIYRMITTYALEALCASLRTHIASWFTIRDLFNVMCTRDCVLCGSFGGFIFLPTFMRCCFPCIKTARQLRLVPLAGVKKALNLSQARLLNSVPVLRTTPGIYSMDEIPRRRRIQILAEESIINAVQGLPDKETKIQLCRSNSEVSLLRYMATTALPYFDKASGGAENGLCCNGCQIDLEESIRTSRINDSVFSLRDRVYSRDGFIEHFQRCPKAQSLWGSSNEGVVPVEVPESSRRGGYFNKRNVVMSY